MLPKYVVSINLNNFVVNYIIEVDMYSCVVVIPVYKPLPDVIEEASFIQCVSVLRKYDISLVTHQSLDISWYNIVSNKYGKTLKIKYFDNEYFSSIKGYNKLCLSKLFYEAFKNYDYMLIYQLDAWVFRDELQYWCDRGYDYIGSLFFEVVSRQGSQVCYSTNITGMGNGGFSLRKISYCISLLEHSRWKPYLKPSYLYKIYLDSCNREKYSLSQRIIKFCKIIPKSFGIHNNVRYFSKIGSQNEDYIFSEYAANAFGTQTNFPPYKSIMSFSFEVNPSYQFSITHKLPFGCHAFEKWEYETFWREYIKI